MRACAREQPAWWEQPSQAQQQQLVQPRGQPPKYQAADKATLGAAAAAEVADNVVWKQLQEMLHKLVVF